MRNIIFWVDYRKDTPEVFFAEKGSNVQKKVSTEYSCQEAVDETLSREFKETQTKSWSEKYKATYRNASN